MDRNSQARRLVQSFRYAFRGIGYCLINERNFRIHIAAACCVLFFSRFYGLSRAEIAVLLLTVSIVMAAELINTAIERLVDMLSPSYNPLARLAKDIAAGAVLIFSLIAVAIGFVMFWDVSVFSEIARYLTATPMRLLLFVILLLAAGIFIFAGPRGIAAFFKKLFGKKKNNIDK